MNNEQAAPPEGFNNPDWQLHKGNKNHVRFLKKCVATFWLIWECQQLTGEAFFTQQWLAKKLECSVRHVQNIIAELLSKNLIEVDRRDQNYYKITEFFSKSPGEFLELAKQRAKAAIAKFFATSPKATAHKQASKPKTESSFRTAKAQSQSQQAPSQAPASQQAVSREEIEELQRRTERYEAELKAEREVDPKLQAEVKEVAKQLARENFHNPKPSAKEFIEWLKIKLDSCGIQAPSFLVNTQGVACLQQYGYLFR